MNYGQMMMERELHSLNDTMGTLSEAVNTLSEKVDQFDDSIRSLEEFLTKLVKERIPDGDD